MLKSKTKRVAVYPWPALLDVGRVFFCLEDNISPRGAQFNVLKLESSNFSCAGRRKNLVIVKRGLHHRSVGARRNSSESRSWLLERKDILEKIKDQVRLYLGEESRDLRLYAGSYKRDIMREWKASDLQTIYTCLQQVQVVFGGDFHPFSQAQRAHLRILRKMVEDRPVVLALECLFVEHQGFVDQFLAGEMSEKQFLRKVQWDSKWGFPWTHYRPFFDFARTHKLPLLGLNVQVEDSDKNLHMRDKFAAQALVNYHQRFPEALIYVVYGDLHVAENHLPKALKQAIRPVQPSLDMATLYLNSEHIYFSLADKHQ